MPEWMTVSEAAAYLKVDRKTIYRWCDAGRLPFYELESGGGRRFKREDLDALLKPGRAGAVDEALSDLHRRMQRQMLARGAYSDAFEVLAILVGRASGAPRPSGSRQLPAQPALDRGIAEAELGALGAERPLVSEAGRLLRERQQEPREGGGE